MRIKRNRIFFILFTLLVLSSICIDAAIAQYPAYTQLGLPKHAKVRLSKGWIKDIACSPDGSLLAIAGGAGIWLYDTETHQEHALLTGHNIGGVNCISLSMDGKTLASAGEDRTVRVWDITTAKLIATLTGGRGGFNSISLSADGKILAAASRNSHDVLLWDIATTIPKATLKGHPTTLKSVSLSADGTLLASASEDQTIILWDVTTTTRITTHTEDGAGVHVAPNADGTLLASGGIDNALHLWDAKTLTKKASIITDKVSPNHSSSAPISCLVWNANGRLLASGKSDGTIRVWDITDTSPILKATLVGYEGDDHITGISWNADSTLLTSATLRGRVHFWDIKTTIEKPIPTEYMGPYKAPLSLLSRPPIHILTGYMGELEDISLNPDATLLVSCDYNGIEGIVRLWDVRTATLKMTLNPHLPIEQYSSMRSVSFNPDGTLLAIGTTSGTIYIWNPHTVSLKAILTGQKGIVRYFGWSADSTVLASAGRSETVHVWDVKNATQKVVLTEYGEHDVKILSLNADGTLLAIGSHDDTVRVWNVTNAIPALETTLIGHTNVSSIHDITWNEDGTMLTTASSDGTVRLWDITNATQKAIFTYMGGGFVSNLSLNADGTILATTSSNNRDSSITLWDVTSAMAKPKANPTSQSGSGVSHISFEMLSVKAVLIGHTDTVNSLSWSSDGKLLASGSEDGTMFLWDISELNNLNTNR